MQDKQHVSDVRLGLICKVFWQRERPGVAMWPKTTLTKTLDSQVAWVARVVTPSMPPHALLILG